MNTSAESPEARSTRMVRALDGLAYAGILAYGLVLINRWGLNFFDPYLQSDDTRIVTYPFWSYHSDLFEHDYLAQAMMAWTTWLYRLLVYGLTFVFDLLTVPKLLQLAALGWSCFHTARMGHRRGGGLGALLGIYLVFHSDHMLQRTGGGLPRAFAYPLLLMLWDALDTGRSRIGGAATVLAFALYPPAGLIASLIYSGWIVFEIIQGMRASEPSRNFIRQRLLELLVTGVLSAAALLPAYLLKPEVGRLRTLEEAREMPSMGSNGRTLVLPLQSLGQAMNRERHRVSRISPDAMIGTKLQAPREGDFTPYEFALLLGFIFLTIRKPRETLLPLLMLGSGILCFFAAKQLAFRLYIPARMLTLSVPIVAMGLATSAFSSLGKRKSRGPGNSIFAGLCLLALILLQGLAFPGYPHLNVYVGNQRPLFDLIQTLPKDSLIAGHPGRLDNIPLWGKRPVLINMETSQPLYTKLWEETEQRLDASLNAYYATGLEPVRKMKSAWPVTHMLINDTDLKFKTVFFPLFAPYGERMQDLVHENWDNLIWRDIPESAIVGRASGFTLIDLEALIPRES